MKIGYTDAGKDMNNSLENNGVVKSDALNQVYSRLADDIPDDPQPSEPFFPKAENC